MDPKQIPLRDLHLPEVVGWWPLAPGWWVLLAMLVIACGFLVRAWLGGIGVAAVAGPLGCFVVWRRMAYFGDTLAHGALLGVDSTFATPALAGVFTLALVVVGHREPTVNRQPLSGLDRHAQAGRVGGPTADAGVVAGAFGQQVFCNFEEIETGRFGVHVGFPFCLWVAPITRPPP